MPIRESQKARYPADWATVIVPRIRARSGNRCECRGDCGIDHEPEMRMSEPEDTPLFDLGHRPTGPARAATVPYDEARCEAVNGWLHPITRSLVVLTVAHLNHTPEDCSDDNLLHMCQRCHLKYDAAHHAETRAASRAAEFATRTAQMQPLFDLETSTETT